MYFHFLWLLLCVSACVHAFIVNIFLKFHVDRAEISLNFEE